MIPTETDDLKQVWEILKNIPDPEIPVISITDLGIIRSVDGNRDNLLISITPTYSGCPAMKLISETIINNLREQGFHSVFIKNVFSPAWTTAWLSEDAKKRMQDYGIAPPEDHSSDAFLSLFNQTTKPKTCPFCKSIHTELKSQYGSTACKSLYFCNDCHQPFEYFKCI